MHDDGMLRFHWWRSAFYLKLSALLEAQRAEDEKWMIDHPSLERATPSAKSERSNDE